MAGNDTPLSGVKACVFDAYGTLFDFASAAKSCRDVLGDKADALTALWRDKQLQYSWLRAVQGRHADFWQVTGDGLDYALETLAIEQPGLRDRLMALYLALATFPEVPAMLRKLKQAGMRTRHIVERLAAHARGDRHRRQDRRAARRRALGRGGGRSTSRTPPSISSRFDRLGVPAGAIAFQSSNAWDAHAASAFGMQVVWCNRYGQRRERLPGAPDREIRSLAELPGLVGVT